MSFVTDRRSSGVPEHSNTTETAGAESSSGHATDEIVSEKISAHHQGHLGQAVEMEKSNGLTNGVTSQSEIHNSKRTIHQPEQSAAKMSFSEEQHAAVLSDNVTITRQKFLAELHDIDESYIQSITLEGFLEYIERQRLTHMPHRASHWDKVLKWAEFFALQISGYVTVAESFVLESKTAAQLIWVASRSLLELGPENSPALEKTFGEFYRLGLSVSMLLRDSRLLTANRQIRSEVGQAFNTLLHLVREASLYYVIRLRTPTRQISSDFNEIFGEQVTAFHRRKNHIIDAMWQHSLGDEATTQIRTLRKWLGPRDSTLQKFLKSDCMAPGDRNEFTCEWFQSHLLAFSRSKNDVLAIHGSAGCGKSVLSNWIVERLQRPLGRKVYVTLSCPIEADIPGEATSLAIAKRLLQQCLEMNVGYKKLYNDLAKALHNSATKSPGEVEEDLWSCLNGCLGRAQKANDTMIVIDGLDHCHGGEKVAKLVGHRLASLAAKHPQVQVILLSRFTEVGIDHGKQQPFAITPNHVREDLLTVIDHSFGDHKHFRSRSEHSQEKVVEQILHAAKGNFLWAILTTMLLKRETSEDGLNKAIKAAKETLLSLDETIAKLANIVDISKAESYQLTSLMLVAERPLTALELKDLLQIDLAKRHSTERKTELSYDIKATLDPLVIVHNGFVRFYHPTVRSYMLKLQEEGKRLRSRQIAHTEMLKRLLAYCNFSLSRTGDVSLSLVAKPEVAGTFSTRALLEYAVHNWILHFRSSTMYHSPEAYQLDDDLKAIFPSTTQLSLLEWACWDYEPSSVEAIKTIDLAFRIRKAVFSEQHLSVLQTLIACGNLWRKANKTMEAADCFYRASLVGQQVLNRFHSVTAACTTNFISITERMTMTSRTELVTRKERMLIYIIELHKSQHGKTHDLVIQYYKLLAQLYVDIREENKAESTWRELREIVVTRFGKGSQEEITISENLTIVLKEGDKKTDIVEYEHGIFDIITELEVWDARRIKLTIELALSYEKRDEFLLAEELFVYLWRRLTEESHQSHHHGVKIHILLLDIVIEYAHFLRRRHQCAEASNVLICIWTEYEDYEFESEVLFLRLKAVGELMRTVSLLSVAVAIFKKCVSWFKSRGMHEHKTSCEVLVTETVKEISKITTKKSASTVTTTETILLKETFESTLSRTTVTIETLSVCQSLISHYMRLEQWPEAIEATRSSLLLIWKSVISGGGTIALPKDFGTGAIDIAISLAVCHHRSGHFHEAEEIYVRIYRACRSSCRIDDERLIKACKALVQFYEEHHHWHQIIELYKELLVEHRSYLGAKSPVTIHTLYTLGSLCADHGRTDAHEYYLEIISVLNHGSHLCHPDALEAMMFVCRYHYEAGHWHRLQAVCKVLWETWKGHHSGHEKFTTDIVETLYFRYRYVLEHQSHTELSVLRHLAIEYRNTCIKVFGATAAITIKASLELAQISLQSEKHLHEAISIYDEILAQTRTTKTTSLSSTTVTIIRQRLTEAYIRVCSHDSVSTTTIGSAIRVVTERYEYLRLTYGWAHAETLVSLHEVLRLHLRSNKQESSSLVIRMLLEATVQIIITEKDSQALHDAGRTIGQIYVGCGMSSVALETIQELRLHIITGRASEHNKHGLKVDKSVGTTSFIFLIALEQVVRGVLSVSYAQAMADYLTESVLYESYNRSLGGSAITIISHTARLRAFLLCHERHSQRQMLEKQSYDIFVKKWAINARSQEIGHLFYTSLLVQIGDTIREVQIDHIACLASFTEVRGLLESGQAQKAYEVAECAFDFIERQRSYHDLHNIPTGLKLATLLACRDLEDSIVAQIDHKLRENMLELSRKVIRGVLRACTDSNIDFVRLKLHELSELVGLLGEQRNHADLDWILELLWKSREVQKNWKPSTIIAIGRSFVQARYLNTSNERRSEAIRLCEDICYNMRRTWGSLDPKTLEMTDLLSQLYTNMGHYREAQDLHENILRLVVEGDDGDDRTHDTMDSKTALHQIDLLKQSYLRLKGWNKSLDVYDDIVRELKNMPVYRSEKAWKQLSLPSEWSAKETPSETIGKFFAPKEWGFVRSENVQHDGSIREAPSRPGMNMKRATSNWGMGLFNRMMDGDHGHGRTNGRTNSDTEHIGGKQAIATDGEEGYQGAEVMHVQKRPERKAEVVY